MTHLERARSHPITEPLLKLMEEKDHWGWPRFTQPGLTRSQLLIHFRHEYQVYVRDFPTLLARVLGMGPPSDVRGALAENIYEEQTGKLSFGVSHPDLFVEMMGGLSISKEELEAPAPSLEPEAQRYRSLLDRVSAAQPWQVGMAVLTLWVEGSRHERDDLLGTRKQVAVEDAIREHPLVKHYGCPMERMRLIRAHRLIEGDHRADAWRSLLAHLPLSGSLVETVLEHMVEAKNAWLGYRDGVLRAMGIARDAV